MNIKELIGKTFTSVTQIEDEEIHFNSDEKSYKLYHDQDCCEHVVIKDLCGDLSDLENTPILSAIESSNDDESGSNFKPSQTWTFYRIQTAKGLVVLCWDGSSNGYYSESVSFDEM